MQFSQKLQNIGNKRNYCIGISDRLNPTTPNNFALPLSMYDENWGLATIQSSALLASNSFYSLVDCACIIIMRNYRYLFAKIEWYTKSHASNQ